MNSPWQVVSRLRRRDGREKNASKTCVQGILFFGMLSRYFLISEQSLIMFLFVSSGSLYINSNRILKFQNKNRFLLLTVWYFCKMVLALISFSQIPILHRNQYWWRSWYYWLSTLKLQNSLFKGSHHSSQVASLAN